MAAEGSSLPTRSAATVTARAAWERQRAVVERACQALPTWAPVSEALRVFEPQLEQLLAGGSAGLADQQRYSAVQLATMAATAAAAAAGENGDVMAAPAAAVDVLPAGLQAALPSICLDFFSSQCLLHQEPGALSPAGPVSKTASAGAAAVAKVGAVVLLLLQARPQLLLPLARRCAEVAVAAAGGKAGGGGGAKRPQGLAGHSGTCAKASFVSSASLLQQVLRCRPLHVTLLQLRDDVAAAVRELVALGREKAELAGDGGCKAECAQLEQVARDLFRDLEV